MRRQFIFVIIFLLCSLNLSAASWALLPVKFSGAANEQTINGASFDPDKPENAWDMAQMLRLYLKSNYVNTVLPMSSVMRAYKNNRIGINSDLTLTELKTLSENIDADKLLLTKIYFAGKSVNIETRIYFSQSGVISDSATISGENLYETIGRSLKQRFQFSSNNFLKPENNYFFIWGIDASGKNYEEIRSLSSLIRELDISRTAAISIDGYGKSLYLPPTPEKLSLFDYLDHIKSQSTDTTDRLFPELLESVYSFVLKNQNEEKAIAVVLVSSAPKSMSSRQKTAGFIRKIGLKSGLLILGNGRLTPEERNFWSIQTAGNSHIQYRDVIYKQKTGLADGNSLYLIKSGNRLLESNTSEIDNSHEIFLSIDQSKIFTQDNIYQTFESATQRKVVSQYKPEIAYPVSMFGNLMEGNSSDSKETKLRLLLLMENKPFWIEVPYRSVLDENGNMLLSVDNSYFFFLNLVMGDHGMPFRNSPNFAEILPDSEVSRILLLNIEQYLKNPARFLNQSIARTSLYIFYGKVKEIKIEKKYIY